MLYDFTARMHEDDIVYIHQRAGIALKTKYSPLVDINSLACLIENDTTPNNDKVAIYNLSRKLRYQD